MNNLSTPVCPHFDVCSGCEIFLDKIPPVWEEVCSFFSPFSIEPQLQRGLLSGWRFKSKLAVRGTSENPLIGLFKKGTHETIPIPNCLVHHPATNQAVSVIIKAIRQSKISIYNETTQKGALRYLQFFVERSSGLVEELFPEKGRDSPTAKGRQGTCRNWRDSSANSALKGRDCARAAVEELFPEKGRDSPTAKGRQVPCLKQTDSSANSTLKGRDCARAAVQLGLVVSERELVKDFCKLLNQTPLWHSIWVNVQPEKTNKILGSSWEKIAGEEWLYQPLLGQKFAFHPGAFSQAHLELFERLLQTLQTWVPENARIVELFAGVGAVGLSLPHQKLLLIENNPFAELSFSAHPFQTSRCEYRVQDATQFDEFDSFDTVVVDPPRKGIGSQLLKKITESKVSRLIYISCGWESFQREALELVQSGWTLQKAEGFLLFPGTNHIETAVLFQRNV